MHPPEGPVPTTPGSGEGQKWSAKEVIGHFMFSERSLNQRIAELAGLPAPLTQVPRVRAMGEQSAEDERQTIDELRRRLDSFFDDTRALLSFAGVPGRAERLVSSSCVRAAHGNGVDRLPSAA